MSTAAQNNHVNSETTSGFSSVPKNSVRIEAIFLVEPGALPSAGLGRAGHTYIGQFTLCKSLGDRDSVWLERWEVLCSRKTEKG